MTTTTALQAQDFRPAKEPTGAGETISVRSRHTIDASAEFTLAADLIRLAILPAGCVPVGGHGYVDDLDSGGSPAVVFSIGIEDTTSGNPTQDLNAFVDQSTAAQAGGAFTFNVEAFHAIGAVDYDRYVVMYCDTPPATDQDGDVSLVLQYVAADRDD